MMVMLTFYIALTLGNTLLALWSGNALCGVIGNYLYGFLPVVVLQYLRERHEREVASAGISAPVAKANPEPGVQPRQDGSGSIFQPLGAGKSIPAGTGSGSASFYAGFWDEDFQKRSAIAITVWLILCLGRSVFALTRLSGFRSGDGSVSVLTLLALTAMAWFIGVNAVIFIRESLKRNRDAGRETAYRIVNAAVWFVFAAALAAGADYIQVPYVDYCATMLLAAFNVLLAIEITLRLVGRWFRPRHAAGSHREVFDLYALEMVAAPGKAAGLFAEMLDRQLGFEVSKNHFFKAFAGSLLPTVFFSVILLWGLTSIVVLNPGEQGLVLRFGKPSGRVLESGFSLKAPWPIETVRALDVWTIRRVRVGSHRTTGADADIYLKDAPILWTNNHGVSNDELLIVAPPADMMNTVKADGKTPSISLVGADITVEYRISDIGKYLRVSADPETYLTAVSMAAASRILYRYDVDELFCRGRIEIPGVLREAIQRQSDRLGLGLEVLNVGLGGVHPPQAVASAFQEPVVALQQKEMTIESAKQYEIQNLVGATGSLAQTHALLDEEKDFSKLSQDCNGEVAVVLADARAYRCERANAEFGKADRFRKERLLYQASPRVYLNDCLMSTLEAGLAERKKYVIIGERDKLVLRFDCKELNYKY
ncbi:MAG: SPFH domain-containing protein [Victivallaceae bacterium]|nr:SPFH domain-containing protein [Victivallaceae bacterium]